MGINVPQIASCSADVDVVDRGDFDDCGDNESRGDCDDFFHR